MYGTRPWVIFLYSGEASVAWITRHGLVDVKDGTAAYKQKSEDEKVTSMKKGREPC
jgi:hypothetical protein